MAVILITGGTGLIGKALTALLIQKGHEVIILSREAQQSEQAQLTYATWNIAKQTVDNAAISKADYIVHLAGAGVADKRWSKARKQEIEKSRTQSSALLIKGLEQVPNNVKAVISASAIGWYGADEDRQKGVQAFTEDMPSDDSFLGRTCKLWEESIAPVESLGKRLVKLRLGIVLSKQGGALKEFIKPIKLGVAAVLGSGKQVISWVHIEDVCRMILFAIENERVSGVYNATAPIPVTNHDLVIALANKIKGRFYIPAQVPSFVLKIMLGELSIEVLKSATVSSEKIKHEGFTFLYPSIEAAIPALV